MSVAVCVCVCVCVAVCVAVCVCVCVCVQLLLSYPSHTPSSHHTFLPTPKSLLPTPFLLLPISTPLPSQPHRCSSEPVPGRPSQWQHQQGQGWHEEGPPAPPEEYQCSGAEVAHQDHTEGSCSCGGEGNPEGTKDLVFNPFVSGSTCACHVLPLPTSRHVMSLRPKLHYKYFMLFFIYCCVDLCCVT